MGRRRGALQGRYSRIAQGGMRAKPDMKPWVHADKNELSSVGAALPSEQMLQRINTTQQTQYNDHTQYLRRKCRP